MIKKYLIAGSVVLMSVILCLSSCKKEDSPGDKDNGLDRKPMLTHYADQYILPAYNQMQNSLNVLKTKADAFAAAPDENTLGQLQQAWKNAYIDWQKTDLVEFGPGEEVSLRMYMNTYPTTPSKIDNNIATGSYDLETFGNKDAQGFPGLDYLLNGIAGTPAAIVTLYTTDMQATARKQYVQAIITKMIEKVNGVKQNWASYRTTFVEKTGTDANSSLSKMTNAFVLYYERYLRSGKIGYPAGVMTGVALPSHTEAFYSPTLSKELAVASLKSVIAFYEGKSYDGSTSGACMKTYLAAIGTKDAGGNLMADVISTRLQEALAALEGLNGTIKNAVTDNRTEVLKVYEELQQVVALFKVDMVSAFGISITYVDNDGD